jgi:hypothetical protein
VRFTGFMLICGFGGFSHQDIVWTNSNMLCHLWDASKC